MSVGVYYIESSNVLGASINQKNIDTINELKKRSGLDLGFVELEKLKDSELSLVFVGGGGTEGKFLKIFPELPQPIILLTTGENNSLAASMEILSFLQQQKVRGEIIHGDLDTMAKRISILYKVFSVKKKIAKAKLGRVGNPSDWLISSSVDAVQCKKETGIEIIDISMQEFFDEIAKEKYEDNQYTKLLKAKNYKPEDTEKALQIYGALKRLCLKYELTGVTVRCFDLLKPIKNTGCVALAILNAEGVYSGCEGDVPALIGMMVLGELSGKPIFMANPSRIMTEKDEIIFAHCTLPINMPTAFRCMTHFESGLGVALAGDLQLGDLTIFKCSGLMDRYFVTKGELVANLCETNLCRTQLEIKLPHEALSYFLTRSIGNHHLICIGDYVEVVEEFFKWFN